MAERIQETPIRSFGPVSVLTDSTETAPKLTLAKNVRLRPIGSICGPPLFDRLAQIGNSQFVDDIFFGLTYTPFGGSPRALVRATDKTIAIDVSSQGEHWLVFYSLNSKKNRGLHYMGNDGTFHGVANFVTGTATMQVLAVGLNDNARWYSSLNYGALHLGNGVDANAIVQLSRTSQSPGKWRLAGSNQRPAAAVLRQIVPTSTNAVTASWTIPGTNGAQFNANSAAGGIYFSPSADGSTNVFTDPTGPHGLLADDQIIFDGTPPSGITVDVAYFVLASGLTANSFKVSATSGGSPIDIGSVAVSSCFVTLVSKVWAPNHAFSVGDIVNVASTVALPSELTTAAYYVVTATADEVGLSDTLGGNPINVFSRGVGICTLTIDTPSGARAGPAALTFTADARNYPGTLGDNIYVSIAYMSGGYDDAISSTLAGSGTVSDPFHYAIFTGPGFSSTQAIVDFVNNDTNATGILIASADMVDVTEDTQSWAFHELTGGVDASTINGVAVGFSDKTCTVFLRYWDVGVDHIGYEGISSDISNTVIIDALSNYGIEVAITPNPTVESSRFGFIRVYFQFGEDVQAQWNLVGEVPNTIATKAVTTFAAVACTVNTSTDEFTSVLHGLGNGTALRFTASGLPSPISSTVTYYVVSAATNTFKVALTPGGAAVNLTTAGTAVLFRKVQSLSATANPFVVGNVVRFTTSGTLPAGLALATSYYVVAANSTSFSVANQANGTPVNITDAGTGTHTATLVSLVLQVGAFTPIGPVMSVDQNRPVASKHSVMSGGNVWHGGAPSQASRLYPSKQAVFDELFPEGANSQAYELVRFPASVSNQNITALYSDEQNLFVHSAGAIVYFPPSNPDAKVYPRVFSGAVTASALSVWTKNQLNYLGGDLQLYEQTQSAIQPLQSEFLALDAAAYIRSYVDLNSFATAPDRSFMFSDIAGQILWLFVPGLDGKLVGFAFDRLHKGITGPFSSPKVYAMTRMEVGRPEYIFADEDGNLFCWNSALQYDSDCLLPTNATPTIHTVGSGATTPSEAGFEQTSVPGVVVFSPNNFSNFIDATKVGVNILHGLTTGDQVTVTDTGLYDGTWTITVYDASNFFLNGAVPAGFIGAGGHYTSPSKLGEYWRSSVIETESGFMDMSKSAQRKHFLALLFTSVQNSRGLATVTFTDKSGRAVSVVYGDVYRKAIRDVAKVLIGMSDTAIKIKLSITTAEMRPIQIRDMVCQWRSQGQL